MSFVLKTRLDEPIPERLAFAGVKTMYGGKAVKAGDELFLFASEISGGRGLTARGQVEQARAAPRRPGPERQTPRVDLDIRVTALTQERLGRAELKTFTDWDDGRPQSELNFKFYRQATDKLCGVSPEAAQYLASFFDGGAPSQP